MAIKLIFLTTKEGDARQTIRVETVSDDTSLSWRFGSVINIKGTEFVALPLKSVRSDSKSIAVYKNDKSDTRNYLFINSNTGDQRWLLPHNDFVFDTRYTFTSGELALGNRVDNDFMFEFIDKDSNGDGQLSDNDQVNIAFAKSDGSSFTVAVEDVDVVLGKTEASNSRVLLFFQKAGVGYSANFDLIEYSLDSVSPLQTVSTE